MKVLITGAAGFIGGAISKHLIKHGIEVIAFDQKQPAIEGLSKIIQMDIGVDSPGARIADEIGSCDAIVHAAAVINMGFDNPDVIITNCLGTQQLLRSAEILEARCFVYLSSVPVIGVPKKLPITEDHPAEPLTAYHASKLFGEHLVGIASGKNLAGTILRLTSPVGPGMPDNKILSAFVRRSMADLPLQLIGRGTRKQNYVDVRDVAEVIWSCLQRRFSGIFNIAGRTCISNIELAEKCIRILRSSSEMQFIDRKDPEEGIVWDVSIKKAEKVLAYNPLHDIDNTILAMSSQYADRIH